MASNNNQDTNDGCCDVDKKLVPYKVHYLLLNAAHVGVVPYLPVYAKTTLGCSATTVGLLATCMQFSTTISKPVFGLVADYLNQMKLLIAFLLIVEVVVNLLMLALPPLDPITTGNQFYIQPPHLVTELVDANSILRFAPARVYDATVGLHSKPKANNPEENSKLRRNAEMNQTFNLLTQDVYGALPRFNEHRQIRWCSLNCDTLISKSLCYQDSKCCLDVHTSTNMSCSLRERNVVRVCKGLQRSLNFSVVYKITNHNITEPFFNFDATVYKLNYTTKLHRRFQTSSCNIEPTDCNLTCDLELKLCHNKQSEEANLYHTYQFWTFCSFALIGAMCQGAVYTLSDTACYERLRGTTADYGRQRLWGAIGWGAVAPITGFFNDLVSGHTVHDDYSSGWYIMAILSVFFLLNLYCMEFPEPDKSSSAFNNMKGILTSKQFVFMNYNVFFIGLFHAYTTNYVIWYMESLGSNRMQMGLALAVECLFGETPFMFIAGWVIYKMGHWNVITLTFATFAIRFGAYYLITNPWFVLPVEITNGITYGIFYTMMTSYGELISPPGAEATVQGILGGTYQGLGSGVGCLIAGITFDKFGGRRSFLLVAIFSAFLALGHFFIILVWKPQRTNYEKLDEVEA